MRKYIYIIGGIVILLIIVLVVVLMMRGKTSTSSVSKSATSFTNQQLVLDPGTKKERVLYYSPTDHSFKSVDSSGANARTVLNLANADKKPVVIKWSMDKTGAVIYHRDEVDLIDLSRNVQLPVDPSWRNMYWSGNGQLLHSISTNDDNETTEGVYSYNLATGVDSLLFDRTGVYEDKLAQVGDKVVILQGGSGADPVNLMVTDMTGRILQTKTITGASEFFQDDKNSLYVILEGKILKVSNNNSKVSISEYNVSSNPGQVRIYSDEMVYLNYSGQNINLEFYRFTGNALAKTGSKSLKVSDTLNYVTDWQCDLTIQKCNFTSVSPTDTISTYNVSY